MTTTLNPQIVGQAEHAHRAVLDRLLAAAALTYHQWVALVLTTNGGGDLDRGALVARIAGAVKVDEATALAAVTELTALGLLATAPDGSVTLTDAGRARHRDVRGAVDEVVGRVYGDLPAEDLATAARVLTTITRSLDADLAAGH